MKILESASGSAFRSDSAADASAFGSCGGIASGASVADAGAVRSGVDIAFGSDGAVASDASVFGFRGGFARSAAARR